MNNIDIKQLINEKKFKKALNSLQKLHKKQPCFDTFELLAMCHFNLKQYAQSAFKLEQALALCPSNEKKYDCYTNLAASKLKLNDPSAAIQYYDKALNVSIGQDKNELRVVLCQLAKMQKNWKMVVKHSEKLSNSKKYAFSGYLLTLEAALHLENTKLVETFNAKILSELHTIPENIIVQYIQLALSFPEKIQKNKILEVAKKHFQHTAWFRELSAYQELPLIETEIAQKTVTGDNKQAISLTKKLVADVNSNGGNIDPSVSFQINNGNLAVFANSHGAKNLLSIPIKCTPLLSDYEFRLSENEQLIVESKENQLNPSANKAMLLLSELYNCTNKLAQWKITCPYIALKEFPEILTAITQLKSSRKNDHFLDLLKQGSWDKLLIDSFLGSRTFTFKQDQLLESGIQSSSHQLGLLNLIDFLNHKMHSPGFKFNRTKHALEVNSNLTGNSGELFAQYNLDDPVMTFLIYGFVDTQSPWIFSVPCQFSLESGVKINIQGASGYMSPEKLSPELKDCAAYYPPQVKFLDNTLELANFIIPNEEAVVAINRVFDSISHELSANGIVINKVEFFTQLCAHNLHHWSSIQDKLEKAKSKENFPSYMEQQITSLINYATSHIANFKRLMSIL